MREIKFRAWDKRKNEWIDNFRVFMHGNIEVYTSYANPHWQPYAQKHYELMQYTGLKDKNGKEIYEMDIIKIDWGGIKDSYIIDNKYDKPFVIEWRFYSYPPFSKYLPTPDCIEIIGNWYENKELLK